MKDGDALMDSGKLKEALPYFEKVMNKLAFKVSVLQDVNCSGISFTKNWLIVFMVLLARNQLGEWNS